MRRQRLALLVVCIMFSYVFPSTQGAGSQPDFSIVLTPKVYNQGNCGEAPEAHYNVTIYSANFSDAIYLDLSAKQQNGSNWNSVNLTWSISPNPITPPVNQTVVAVLYVRAPAPKPYFNPGIVYNLTVTGTSGHLSRNDTAQLRVYGLPCSTLTPGLIPISALAGALALIIYIKKRTKVTNP